MQPIDRVRRKFEFMYFRERTTIGRRSFGARLLQLLGSTQLMDADRGGHIGHVVLVAGRDDSVVPGAAGVARPGIPREAVQGHEPDAVGQHRVVGRGHAAFTGGDRLVRIEGVTRDGSRSLAALLPRPIGAGTPRRREGVSRVFHNPQTVLAGEGVDRRDVHHEPGDVNRDDTYRHEFARNLSRKASGFQVCQLALRVG